MSSIDVDSINWDKYVLTRKVLDIVKEGGIC